jgi:hypothetical protein
MLPAGSSLHADPLITGIFEYSPGVSDRLAITANISLSIADMARPQRPHADAIVEPWRALINICYNYGGYNYGY